MNVKNLIRFIGLTGFILSILVFVVTPTFAEPESQARWRIEADFTQEEPEVLLIVETGYYEKANWVTTDESNIYLDCIVENVQMTTAGQPAVFFGAGFIACEMLDISAIAYQMTGIEHAAFSGGSGSSVESVLAVGGYGQYNPIFHHPDLQFGATNAGEATLTFAVDGQSSASENFAPGSMQQLQAIFEDSGDPRVHFPAFAVDGNSLQATPEVIESRLFIDHTYDGLIYFGYSPDSGTFLEGEVYTIDVDPGCRGFG